VDFLLRERSRPSDLYFQNRYSEEVPRWTFVQVVPVFSNKAEPELFVLFSGAARLWKIGGILVSFSVSNG
jgi:hypothetical protein